MRILIIEDNAPLRNTIRQYLQEADYVVDTISTGDEGLWAAEGNIHDLILLDLMLPKMAAAFKGQLSPHPGHQRTGCA